MSKVHSAIHNIHVADGESGENAEKSSVHPLSRLLVALFYVLLVVSFDKYDLYGLAGMVLYLLVLGIWDEISMRGAVSRLWPVLLLTGMAGIANPFLDKEIYWQVGNFIVTKGMISMVTLMLKGIFCVVDSYFLMMCTGMEGICYSLRCLHAPKEFVTILLLIYRYLVVLLKEVERMMQAYKLRAPGQRGLHIKTWGAFVGQLLLRSINRAETVYESMLLRGYHGEFAGKSFRWKKGVSFWYAAIWMIVLAGLRVFPVFQMVGRWFQG